MVSFRPGLSKDRAQRASWHSYRRVWLWIRNSASDLCCVAEQIQQQGPTEQLYNEAASVDEELKHNAPKDLQESEWPSKAHQRITEWATSLVHDMGTDQLQADMVAVMMGEIRK